MAGADAVLLIAAVLSKNEMASLLKLTHQLGMNALIEVHTEAELEWVLSLNPKLWESTTAIYKRSRLILTTRARLRQLIPDDVVVVGESGLKTDADMRRMAEIGVDAILVGETLVKSKDVYGTAVSFVKAGKG